MNGKLILSFAGGLAVGAAAGYFIAREILTRRKDEEVQEAWNSARAYIATKEKALKAREEEAFLKGKALVDAGKETVKQVKEEAKEAADGLDIKQIREDAKKAVKAVRSYRRNVFNDRPTRHEVESLDADSEEEINDLLNDLEEDDEYYEDDHPREDIPLREDPYIISADEFVENRNNHEQITLYFYENGAITDDAGNLIDDIDRKIGKENHEELDRLWDSEGTCLIRNEMEYTDYELLKMNEDYIPDTEL